MSEQRNAWGVMVCLGLGLGACNRAQPPPEAHSQPIAGSVALESGSAPLLATNATNATNGRLSAKPDDPSGSGRVTDERWLRAKGEDLADKQALAETLGAAGLVDALDDGGDITTTALACLPLADDAEAALGALAKRVLEVSNELREPYLVALLGIAGRPARAREAVDPEGAAQAGEAVLAIAKNEALPREHRALAISAARAFAEKKIVDSTKIPTDLDPP